MMRLVAVILIYFLTGSTCQLSCKDENNNLIDWFIALKYPKSYDFIYLTPIDNQWKKSAENLSSAENMIGLTIKQSYNSQFFSAYYNDEPVESYRKDIERGHLKGVLNFDQSNGYWLIHSVPKFPAKGSYEYRPGEKVYAQSFICVSVGVENLSQIVGQLLMMESTVYSFNLPDQFSPDDKLMKDLRQFVNNKNGPTPSSMAIPIKTHQNLPLVHFGKSRQFDNDLYAALIAPSLKTSLYVETWIRGSRIPSSCNSQYQVFNIKKLNLPNKIFKESDDHSKWAMSTSCDKPYVCIGDINRMTSQFERGGGSLCVCNQMIWTAFNGVVADYEKCQ